MVTARDTKGSGQATAVAAGGESGAAAGFTLRLAQLSGGQFLLYFVLVLLLIITFIPILYLAALSLKDNGQIYGRFWSMPNPYRWENFGLGSLVIWRPILNSILTSGSSTAATVVLASLAGYVFARHRFPGKEVIYTGILALLMIPPILTLIPAYVLILNMGLENYVLGADPAMDLGRAGVCAAVVPQLLCNAARGVFRRGPGSTAPASCRALPRSRCLSPRRS